MNNIKEIILRKFPYLQLVNGINKRHEINKILYKYEKMNNNSNKIIPLPNYKEYKKTIKRFLYSDSNGIEVVEAFLSAQIEIIKENYKYQDNTLILVCLIKDDLNRVKQLLEYYRKIGIKNFCFIDNNSSDGSFEYLLSQNDVNLYLIKENYTTKNREGWLNRIYSYIGYKKWILCIDSDELFTYIEQEKNSIQDFIKQLNKKNIKRIRCILLDMYSNEFLFESKENNKDLFNNYSFFDADTYYNVSSFRSYLIHGGPRKRIFSTKEKEFNCTVSKYPLFYYERGDFQGCSHWLFPYYKNNREICAVLRHYKFMKNDSKKYEERVKNKNYANSSLEYRKYFEILNQKNKVTFYYTGSHYYKNSFSLQEINVSKDKVLNIFKVV